MSLFIRTSKKNSIPKKKLNLVLMNSIQKGKTTEGKISLITSMYYVNSLSKRIFDRGSLR